MKFPIPKLDEMWKIIQYESIITMVDPVQYCSIHTFKLANLLIIANAVKTRNSQLIDTHN